MTKSETLKFMAGVIVGACASTAVCLSYIKAQDEKYIKCLKEANKTYDDAAELVTKTISLVNKALKCDDLNEHLYS